MGKNSLEMMTKSDNFWYNMDDPTNTMVITAVLEFEGIIDINKFRELWEEKIMTYNRFKQKVVFPFGRLGPAFWKDDPYFDINAHLTRVALPFPGTRDILQRMISELTSTQLDKNKPLWHIHIIENYNETDSVLFIRFHHSIADGIALVRLLLNTTTPEPNLSVKGKNRSIKINTEPEDSSILQKIFNFMVNPIIFTMNAMKAAVSVTGKIAETAIDEGLMVLADPSYAFKMINLFKEIAIESSLTLGRLALMPNDAQTALKGKVGVQKSVCCSEPFPVSDIKKIGRHFDATINDILMSSVAGALRKYFQEKNDDLDDAEFRVAIPVNIRPFIPEIELGNKFSLVFLKLPLFIDDPIERLNEVKNRMTAIKGSTEPFISYQALKGLGALPAKLTKLGAQIFNKKITGVLTNVPGPRQHLYLTDKKMTNQIFWVPRGGNASIGISIFSYAGNVTLGVCTDTGLAPDPQKITDYFFEEFNELSKLIDTE